MAEGSAGTRESRLKAVEERLRARMPDQNGVGCFMCRLILEDLADGKLGGAIRDFQNVPMFPRSGQLAHLKIEGISFVEEDL